MRYVTSLLATTLAILIAAAPASVSACDLSCWLHQAHSDCHSASSALRNEDDAMPPMDMSSMDMSGMDMGAMDKASGNGQVQSASGVPDHSMIHLDLAADGGEQTTEPGASHNGSGSLSSCVHEACGQTAVSASPPRTHRLNFDPSFAPINETLLVNRTIGMHRISPGTFLPDISLANCFTTLRI
jgi:hypothetical protein